MSTQIETVNGVIYLVVRDKLGRYKHRFAGDLIVELKP